LRANRGICAKESQGQRRPQRPRLLGAGQQWQLQHSQLYRSGNDSTHPQLSFKPSTATNSDTTPRYMGSSEPTTVLYISLLDRRNALHRLSFFFSRYVVYWFFSTLSHISSLRLYTTTYTCGSSKVYGDGVTPKSGLWDFHSKAVNRYGWNTNYRKAHTAPPSWRGTLRITETLWIVTTLPISNRLRWSKQRTASYQARREVFPETILFLLH
jgi:hypothetical protein